MPFGRPGKTCVKARAIPSRTRRRRQQYWLLGGITPQDQAPRKDLSIVGKYVMSVSETRIPSESWLGGPGGLPVAYAPTLLP
jgi:hypothetical protein